jgi:hypothetical protein
MGNTRWCFRSKRRALMVAAMAGLGELVDSVVDEVEELVDSAMGELEELVESAIVVAVGW